MVNKYTKKEMISKEELEYLYLVKKMTYKEIAEHKGFSGKIVQNRMKEYNIIPRKAIKRNQNGENNHSWRGGRVKSQTGYIYIRTKDHPRRVSTGYVLEHILVMEAYLGRHLKVYGRSHKNNEVVHHINGIKTDNRIENLKLMTNGKHISLHNKMRKSK